MIDYEATLSSNLIIFIKKRVMLMSALRTMINNLF